MPLVNRLINLFSTVATCTIHACTQYNIIVFFSFHFHLFIVCYIPFWFVVVYSYLSYPTHPGIGCHLCLGHFHSNCSNKGSSLSWPILRQHELDITLWQEFLQCRFHVTLESGVLLKQSAIHRNCAGQVIGFLPRNGGIIEEKQNNSRKRQLAGNSFLKSFSRFTVMMVASPAAARWAALWDTAVHTRWTIA